MSIYMSTQCIQWDLSQQVELQTGFSCFMIRISDEIWSNIKDEFPPSYSTEGKDGPEIVPSRRILEAIVWVLNTGSEWQMLPQCYPNYQLVRQCFNEWCLTKKLHRTIFDLGSPKARGSNNMRQRRWLDQFGADKTA